VEENPEGTAEVLRPVYREKRVHEASEVIGKSSTAAMLRLPSGWFLPGTRLFDTRPYLSRLCPGSAGRCFGCGAEVASIP